MACIVPTKNDANLNAIKIVTRVGSVHRTESITHFNYRKRLKFACCPNHSHSLNHRQRAKYNFSPPFSFVAAVIIFFWTEKTRTFYLICAHYIRSFFCNHQIKMSLRGVVRSRGKRQTCIRNRKSRGERRVARGHGHIHVFTREDNCHEYSYCKLLRRKWRERKRERETEELELDVCEMLPSAVDRPPAAVRKQQPRKKCTQTIVLRPSNEYKQSETEKKRTHIHNWITCELRVNIYFKAPKHSCQRDANAS